ncbi:amidohydrolase family protein [Lachnoclostridium phocaeense]|uniref:amidohydrolase family protein n=1 Tax=Lachnoclostridium phocaeense TaxID=1871021 RepID=UPI00248DAB6D|nr:amidohydrolase family protein [Lachnoclostridium phocaeense]
MKTEADLLIRNSDYLDPEFELAEGKSILIRDGKIEAVDTAESLEEKYTWKEEMDGSGCIYMPGLVDSHMHTGQQLLRGNVLDEMPMIWTRIMLPYESTLTPERMRLSARMAAVEMIHAGTTGFIDAGSYFMAEAAGVYAQSGLRGALSYSTMDQKGLPASIAMDAETAIQKTDELYKEFHGQGNLKVYYSLRSLISCSEDLIRMAAERAAERHTMLQAHMNEYPGEINFYMERKQMRPYEYLDSLGVLGPDFLGAHSLLLSEREISLLSERGVKVCHCPFSNCGKAAPRTPELLERNITVGLGTDGAAHGGLSLFQEMKIFRSVMNLTWGVPLAEPAVMPAKKILAMATRGGQACLGGDPDRDGKIFPGARADLIGIDKRRIYMAVYGHIANTILESVGSGDVRDSVCGGKVLMRDYQIQTLDEEKIYREAVSYRNDFA